MNLLDNNKFENILDYKLKNRSNNNFLVKDSNQLDDHILNNKLEDEFDLKEQEEIIKKRTFFSGDA